jgi:hypothetical protein
LGKITKRTPRKSNLRVSENEKKMYKEELVFLTNHNKGEFDGTNKSPGRYVN